MFARQYTCAHTQTHTHTHTHTRHYTHIGGGEQTATGKERDRGLNYRKACQDKRLFGFAGTAAVLRRDTGVGTVRLRAARAPGHALPKRPGPPEPGPA